LQILDLNQDDEDEGGAVELTSQAKDKCVVIKTSSRQARLKQQIVLAEVTAAIPLNSFMVLSDRFPARGGFGGCQDLEAQRHRWRKQG